MCTQPDAPTIFQFGTRILISGGGCEALIQRMAILQSARVRGLGPGEHGFLGVVEDPTDTQSEAELFRGGIERHAGRKRCGI